MSLRNMTPTFSVHDSLDDASSTSTHSSGSHPQSSSLSYENCLEVPLPITHKGKRGIRTFTRSVPLNFNTSWAGEAVGSGKIVGNRCTDCGRLVFPGAKTCKCQQGREVLRADVARLMREASGKELAVRLQERVEGAGSDGLEAVAEAVMQHKTGEVAEEMCLVGGSMQGSPFRRVLLRRCQEEFSRVVEAGAADGVGFMRFLSELNVRGVLGTKTLRACAEQVMLKCLDGMREASSGPFPDYLGELLSYGQIARDQFSELRGKIVWLADVSTAPALKAACHCL